MQGNICSEERSASGVWEVQKHSLEFASLAERNNVSCLSPFELFKAQLFHASISAASLHKTARVHTPHALFLERSIHFALFSELASNAGDVFDLYYFWGANRNEDSKTTVSWSQSRQLLCVRIDKTAKRPRHMRARTVWMG